MEMQHELTILDTINQNYLDYITELITDMKILHKYVICKEKRNSSTLFIAKELVLIRRRIPYRIY